MSDPETVPVPPVDPVITPPPDTETDLLRRLSEAEQARIKRAIAGVSAVLERERVTIRAAIRPMNNDMFRPILTTDLVYQALPPVPAPVTPPVTGAERST